MQQSGYHQGNIQIYNKSEYLSMQRKSNSPHSSAIFTPKMVQVLHLNNTLK
jgi:hypothetical protein